MIIFKIDNFVCIYFLYYKGIFTKIKKNGVEYFRKFLVLLNKQKNLL